MSIVAALMTLLLQPSEVASLLDGLQWEKRLLFVEAAEAGAQRARLDREGFKERDLVLVVYDEDEIIVLHTDGTPPARVEAADMPAVLGERYAIEGLTDEIFLVGKDGSQKGVWDDPISSETIFELIDSMPMRQREMER